MNRVLLHFTEGFRDAIRLGAAIVIAVVSGVAGVVSSFVSRSGPFAPRARNMDS